MSPFNNSRYTVGARLIFTMLGDALEDHYINVVENRIESFTKQPVHENVYDFGDECAILPGTVNMHAHLELSQVPGPLDVPRIDGRRPMADWIRKLMEFRRNQAYDARQAIGTALLRPEAISESVAVADIVPPGLDTDNLLKPKFPVLRDFWELIAWNPIRARSVSEGLDEGFYGLSPHAPQTVCPELLEAVIKMDVPVAMHLAETPEEIQFLKTQEGPLLDLMRQADPDYDPRKVVLGNRPMDYLKLLAEAPKTFVIHGNYLNDEELEFLAEHRDTMAVVYCPRSHDYFGAREYPLNRMLDLGVRVLLGTDSLASSPDLSIVNEIKFALKHHPGIPPETLFLMGTLHGAEALDLQSDFGTLEPGKAARFAFF